MPDSPPPAAADAAADPAPEHAEDPAGGPAGASAGVSTPSPAPAVRLDGLRRVFGHGPDAVAACDAMSWTAPSGRITAVLGPNGAGKTTAIDCAVGLQRPDGGRVRVLGVDPWGAGPEHRARVGVVLQSGGLPSGTTPLRLLGQLARLYAQPDDVGALAARLGITGRGGFERTTVRRLSGGQKQRLGIAAALVGRPEVLFLDEPTAGLDPHGRLDVWELVAALRDERGTSVVVTTHSFEEAGRLADHVVIVGDGRALAEGSVAELGDDGAGLEERYFALTRSGATTGEPR